MKNIVVIAAVIAAWFHSLSVLAADRPNIVFVMTDDQGYGDLHHTGNPVVKTPRIDALAAESSQLTDYHVAPTCSPTRAALLTGHWTDRTGVWHTVNGRSMLRENEVTIAQMLRDAGYATGLFGKWHLGDNFPYRPEDRGFTEVYRHGGGGVGQTPDLWDNAYFDGRCFHNGRIVPAEGFCTDVFFTQARRFIRECSARNQPFFAYIALNAPHGPLHAPKKYLDLYAEQPPALAAFYGMITNIDDNVGATRQLLSELGIADNTLFVFTTDNGAASGARVYNAGMRGAKGSEYEGGHRVPFIAHWPAAGWNKRHVSDTLCHAVDIVPTLLDITGAKTPDAVKFDGRSIRALLDPAANTADWPHDRMLVTDSQRVRDPIKWKQTAVMSRKWRLVNGKELYDLHGDPGQQKNVVAEHPEQAAKMIAFYDAWWAELEPTFAQTTEIHVGHPEHPVVSLTGHDWIQHALPPWNQQHIRVADGFGPRPQNAVKRKPAEANVPGNKPAVSRHQGHWAVKVLAEGSYEISLRRWPLEADQPIVAELPAGDDVPGADKAYRARVGRAIPAVTATLRIDGHDLETKPVESGDRSIRFTATLAAGSHQLAPFFTSADGNEVGAYYTIITKQPSGASVQQAHSAEQPRVPNVVFIVADDMGYADLGTQGARGFKTPHLDRLAEEGTRFTSFYVAQAVCTASRAALMTGCYPNRVGMHGAYNHTSRDGIADEEWLLPEMFKERGYATAGIGKWHLGTRMKFHPLRHGFDEWLGIPYSNDNTKYHPSLAAEMPPLPLYDGEKVVERDPDQSLFTKRFTERAIDFIERNASRPFFLYIPHVMPHVPIFASEKFQGRSQAGLYGDVIEELDWSVGEVLATLRRLKLDERTLVIFISDNGPFLSYGDHAGSATPLREGKLTTFEGGVRVPCLVRWSGRIPAGRVCAEPFMGIDWIPTLTEIVGGKAPTLKIDGRSAAGLIFDRKDALAPHEALYFYSGTALQAVRSGSWKLHFPHPYITPAGEPGRGGKPSNWGKLAPTSIKQSGVEGIATRHGYRIEQLELALFNLETDPGEQRNVAASHPDVVERLSALAADARREIGDSLQSVKGTGLRSPGLDNSTEANP